MENKSHAFVAGLFVLLFGLSSLLAFYWLRGGQDDSNDYVVVTKQNIGGLNPQAQVRYRGIRVGKVSDIRLDPDDYSNILITISISDDVPLTKGTVAKLNYQGVTGLAHILLLETGKDKEPLVPDNAKPPQIPMIPSLLDEVGETGVATIKQARQFMIAANETLGPENRAHLTASLANLNAASGELKPAIANLNSALVKLNKALDQRNLDRLSGALAEAGPALVEVRQLASGLQGTAGRIDAAFGDASGNGLTALMPRLHDMAGEVTQTSRQLGRVMRILEDTPQGLILGAPPVVPGPGEPGFAQERNH